jgi:hypothetical protein
LCLRADSSFEVNHDTAKLESAQTDTSKFWISQKKQKHCIAKL